MPSPGRTPIPIDKEELSKWARAGCTRQEIAQGLGISLQTLERRLRIKEFRECIPKAHAELKISLRTKQVQLALAGNVTMLIWLGKQILGQADKQEVAQVGNTPAETALSEIRATLLDAIREIPDEHRKRIAAALMARSNDKPDGLVQ
jgi:transcriptional regulator with XRE-family HTH domain